MNKYTSILLLTISLLGGGPLLLETGAQENILSSRPSPTIDITAAVAIAAQYVADKDIDISRHFLKSAVYHDSGPWTQSHMGKGPYWQITYELDQYADGGQVFVMVYMDKTTGHTYGE